MHNIFTNNPDFYPTPADVIDHMLLDEEIAGKTILEPSAGKGDIADALRSLGAREVITCEKDPNLRAILVSKGYDILEEDFLAVTAEQTSQVDMIVMNPPFSEDMKHILHAWDIAPAGCTVISLCNASHIHSGWDDTSSKRRLLEVIEDNGWSENISSSFREAERPTACEIGLIKLYKGGTGENEFDGFVTDGAPDTWAGGNSLGVITYDFMRDIVNRYCAAVRAFDEVKAKAEEINRLAQFPDAGPCSEPPIRFLAVRSGSDGRAASVSHDRYKKELQKYYWRIIFQKMNLDRYATKGLREQINKFVERQQNMPFTMRNIYHVIDIIFQTNGQRMDAALLEAFDTICSLSAENSTAGEKWKTNSDYMVNRRFIVPNITDAYYYCSGGSRPSVKINYGFNTNTVNDITRVLCHFTGRSYEAAGDLSDLVNRTRPGWGEWFLWGFFRCKGFKKGTMHFEFVDEDVWAEFNRRVASLRGWQLPKTRTSGKRSA